MHSRVWKASLSLYQILRQCTCQKCVGHCCVADPFKRPTIDQVLQECMFPLRFVLLKNDETYPGNIKKVLTTPNPSYSPIRPKSAKVRGGNNYFGGMISGMQVSSLFQLQPHRRHAPRVLIRLRIASLQCSTGHLLRQKFIVHDGVHTQQSHRAQGER